MNEEKVRQTIYPPVGSEAIVIARPNAGAIESEFGSVRERAYALVIESREGHEAGLEAFKLLRLAIKKIDEHHEPTRAALEKAKKEILAARDRMRAPFEDALRIVGVKITRYEALARREALMRAEDERKSREEAERAIVKESIAAEEAGDSERAAEIITRPIETPPPMAPVAEVAKVAGVSERQIYRAEVVSLEELIRYVAANLNGAEPGGGALLLANSVELNTRARAAKESLVIPGVRVVVETVRAVRVIR